MTFDEFYDGTKARPGAYLLDERKIAEGAWNRAVCEVGFRSAAVREIHKPMPQYDRATRVDDVCAECSGGFKFIKYPCPTIRALDGETDGK